MRKLLAMSAQPARYSGEITAEMRAVDPEIRVRDLERQVTAVEEKLARAEDDLARVLQISHSFIYETDADLRMTLVNGDSREILGAAPSELIGKRLGAFLSFEDGPADDGNIAERNAFRNLVCRSRDGTRHIHISGKPLRDAVGRFCGYHGVISDATALIEAEERAASLHRRFREAIECIPASLMLFDADDRLVICNSASQNFFPGAKDLLIPGSTFEDLLRADIESGYLWKTDLSVDEWITDRVARHRCANTDVIGALPDGRWIQVVERPTTDGGVIGIRINVTEVKQKEAELEEKTRQLEEHGRELKRSNTELEQFAYVASHDLQEPLRMVASYCQLLKRRYAGKLDADADDFIGYAVEGASRMQRLINDLLSYSRVGHRGETFAPVFAADLVRAALGNLEAAIADAGARIEIGDLPQINADRSQLVQLFQNLIGNAIKFRRDEPPVVRISAMPDGAFAQFVVEDNGIGIERDYVEKVFLIFQRLHDRDKYSGTGIGLAIVKKVVERHGGKVWIDSTPGQGSRFQFTLPLVDWSQSDE
jgi:PAS domain S-box-containing protein